MTTHSFRFLRPGDEPALADLARAAVGLDRPPAWWTWKLFGRPCSTERAVVAEEDGAIVSHVGGIPCGARIGGRDASVMVAVDAMTHPDRRRRGLLTGAYRLLFERWRADGVQLVLGMPNERHGLRVAERGWQPLFRMEWRVRLLRPECVLSRRAGVPALARATLVGRAWNAAWDRRPGRDPDLVVDEKRPAAEELDRLWARRQGVVHHGPVRDAGWIRWRYLEAPPSAGAYRLLAARRRGALEGVACWRVREQEGRKVAFLGEITAAPSTPVETPLLAEVLGRCRREGAELVAALSPEGSPRSGLLAGRGFLRSWGAFQLACVPLAEGLEVEALRDPGAWELEGGAFDVV